jgi:hypothetical protein
MYSVSPRVNIFSRGHGGRQQPRSLSAFFCSTKGFVLMSVVVLILWTISLYMFLVVYSMSANVGDPELDPPAILATKNRPSVRSPLFSLFFEFSTYSSHLPIFIRF